MICRIGWHKWYYINKNHNREHDDLGEYHTNIPTRTCEDCGKHQVMDAHCLGLNPPEYIYSWRLEALSTLGTVFNNLIIINDKLKPSRDAQAKGVKLSEETKQMLRDNHAELQREIDRQS